MFKKRVEILNSRGFTLLEMLFSFSIFCIIVSFLPLLMRIMINDQPFEMRNQRMEWEVFISQMKKEVRLSNKLTVNTSQTLLLEKNGKTVIYEKYGTNIRRRVDYKGNEFLLQNVSFFQFERIVNGVRVKVTDIYGREYLEEVRIFIREGVT
jgi:competence protein ComGF